MAAAGCTMGRGGGLLGRPQIGARGGARRAALHAMSPAVACTNLQHRQGRQQRHYRQGARHGVQLASASRAGGGDCCAGDGSSAPNPAACGAAQKDGLAVLCDPRGRLLQKLGGKLCGPTAVPPRAPRGVSCALPNPLLPLPQISRCSSICCGSSAASCSPLAAWCNGMMRIMMAALGAATRRLLAFSTARTPGSTDIEQCSPDAAGSWLPEMGKMRWLVLPDWSSTSCWRSQRQATESY